MPESVSIGETTAVEIEASKAHSQSEAIDMLLAIVETLTQTISSIINTVITESIGLADSIQSTISSNLSLGITDGLDSIALRIIESLSIVRSSEIVVAVPSEDLSIIDNINFVGLDGTESVGISDSVSGIHSVNWPNHQNVPYND